MFQLERPSLRDTGQCLSQVTRALITAPPAPTPDPSRVAAYPSMTGVLCMSLTALSRNWSAAQTATRGQSHQPVHMTPSLGTCCLPLLCVYPDRLSCQKTEAFGPGDHCPTSRLSVISAFPVRVGRWEFLDPMAGRRCLRLGVIVRAWPRCSKTRRAELLPRGQEKRWGGPVTSTPHPGPSA